MSLTCHRRYSLDEGLVHKSAGFTEKVYMVFSTTEASFKRKMPRRRFHRSTGCLCDGQYFVGMGVEIGEGGLSLTLPQELFVGKEVVVSFHVPGGSFVCVRAELKNVQKASRSGWFRMGCLFKNLKFEHKREIRSYVSERSELEQ